MLQSKPFSTKGLFNQAFRIFAGLLALMILITGSVSAATIGVGVGTGKIVVDEDIKPSMDYTLPAISVFNNGDVESEYEMTVQYNEKQDEGKPPENWIRFSPKKFNLAPGKSQHVDIKLNPEYSAKPGKYFAYLEAHPMKKDQKDATAIQVAAATKLYFNVVPANFFMRIYYALQAFWIKYKVYVILATGSLIIATVVLLAKRYLNITVNRKTPTKVKAKSKDKD